MALIDDQMAVISNDVIDLAIANQALDERHIDDRLSASFSRHR